MNNFPISTKDILKTVDDNYVLFYQVLDDYMDKHNLKDVKKRLAETWFRGGGVYRILLTIMGDFLDGSPSSLVAFYKKCQRKEEDPHYEDLITTLLVAVISALVTVLTQTALEKFVKNKRNLQGLQELLKVIHSEEPVDFEMLSRHISEFESPLQYVLAGSILRENMWKKKITKKSHDKTLIRFEKEGISVELLKEIEEQLNIKATNNDRILPNVTKELFEAIISHKGRKQ